MTRDFEETLAPKLYFDRGFDIEAAKILPGEYYVTRRDMLLVTTLGSCIAACIRDRTNGIGGMNHFMLPASAKITDRWSSASTRYGTYAMEVLINQLLKLGAQRSNLEAKLFGGSALIKGAKSVGIGERNTRFGIDYLATEGIPLVAQDLLENYPRKVYYFPKTGRVLVKKLRELHNDTLFEREREYGSRLARSPLEGEVDLFS
jgi:chemotaxis protein CheD